MPDRSASSRAFFGSSRAGLVVVLFALAALFSPLFGPLIFFFGALLFGFAPLLVVLFALFPRFLSLFALVAVIAAVVVLAAAFFAPTALAERVDQHLAHLFHDGSVVAGARDGGRGRDAGDHGRAQRQAAPPAAVVTATTLPWRSQAWPSRNSVRVPSGPRRKPSLVTTTPVGRRESRVMSRSWPLRRMCICPF